MSIDQQRTIGSVVNWSFKIVLGICAYLAVTTFIDMKDSMKSMSADIKDVAKDQQNLRNDLIRLEGKIELHTSEILDLKNKK